MARRPDGRYPWHVLIAAAAVGLVTTYFIGVKPGLYAGCVALGLFALALVLPTLAPVAYLVVAVGLVGIIAVGSKRPHHKRNARYLKRVRQAVRVIMRKP